jgi:hypothetical protein
MLIVLFLGSWISGLLHLSHKQGTLSFDDLYDLLPEYESKELSEQLERHWFEEMKSRPTNPSLFRATIRAMGWQPFIIGSFLIPLVNTFRRMFRFICFIVNSFRVEMYGRSSPVVHHFPHGFLRTVLKDVCFIRPSHCIPQLCS